jgi:hypothetical protein
MSEMLSYEVKLLALLEKLSGVEMSEIVDSDWSKPGPPQHQQLASIRKPDPPLGSCHL